MWRIHAARGVSRGGAPTRVSLVLIGSFAYERKHSSRRRGGMPIPPSLPSSPHAHTLEKGNKGKCHRDRKRAEARNRFQRKNPALGGFCGKTSSYWRCLRPLRDKIKRLGASAKTSGAYTGAMSSRVHLIIPALGEAIIHASAQAYTKEINHTNACTSAGLHQKKLHTSACTSATKISHATIIKMCRVSFLSVPPPKKYI